MAGYMDMDIQGQSDKYLASPPDGVANAREIYYRVVHSCRREIAETVGMSKDRVGPYPVGNFGSEKAVDAMGAAHAHCGQQTQP